MPVFVSSERLIDIDAELTSQNFDVREHFFSAVPLVLYIKWAFAESCWNAPEANACLMIDDPLLKATHGFVDFQELLSLMKRHKFSYQHRLHPMELAEKRSRNCSVIQRKRRDVTHFQFTDAIIPGQSSVARASNAFIGRPSKRSSV